MMKKTATTAMVLALGATLAFAGPGEGKFGKRGKHRGMHRGASIERLAAKLDLTDAQKTQMKAQRENFRAANEQRFATHRDTRKQLRDARQAGDTERAQALASTLEQQRGELKLLRKAQHEAMLKILTAEQRAKLEAMKARRAERRGKLNRSAQQ